MRRVLTVLVIILILGAGGYYIYRQRQAQQTPVIEVLRQEAVQVGTITATVNATGSIEPEAEVSMTFGIAGTIKEVNVVRGQTVSAGDVLATLNTDELALAVQQAQDALEVQRLTLEQRKNLAPSAATLATSQADIDAAEANKAVAEGNLAAAQATLQQAIAQKAQLTSDPTNSELAAAQADISSAYVQQKLWQDRYDRIIQGEILGWAEEEARANLDAANKAYAASQARLADLQAGARPADIQVMNAAIASAQAAVQSAQAAVEVANANIARAQAAYQKLQEPVSQDDLAILEAQVRSAETNLALTQLRFEQSRIVAPIDGKVATVLISSGEQALPGSPAIVIVNEGAFHITINVDEIDIDQIVVGQQVDITLDAIADVTVAGTISDIAPTPQTAGGVITYLVTINITDLGGINLRPGMSANASIVVNEVDNVLTVPNWAIRLDRETGDAYVIVQRAENNFDEVKIITGLRNEQYSEVVSGLSAGDVVVVTNQRDTFTIFGGN
ncbi:MAG: efflux RND transporter periplasmic adaptor subunit [Ardenticatenales bacterium]|nr:efflux RND transporter periplasmic adaptor subunit [Ardenticatenales bacterium]